MFLSDTGDGEAARGLEKASLVLDEIERLPRGKGSEGAFASSVRSEQRATASEQRATVSDHEQLNNDLRNRYKVWTVQS